MKGKLFSETKGEFLPWKGSGSAVCFAQLSLPADAEIPSIAVRIRDPERCSMTYSVAHLLSVGTVQLRPVRNLCGAGNQHVVPQPRKQSGALNHGDCLMRKCCSVCRRDSSERKHICGDSPSGNWIYFVTFLPRIGNIGL